MPAVGKSTVGVLVAKYSGRAFLDTDLAIQAAHQRSLQDIIDNDGPAVFRAAEEVYILALSVADTVLSTGGSVVYSEAAMRHLQSLGPIVHLAAELAEIETRIGDPGTRGLVRRAGQTLGDLYEERLPLYRRWADYTVDCRCQTQEQVARVVIELL